MVGESECHSGSAVLEKSKFTDESQYFHFHADEEMEGTSSKNKQLCSDFKLVENILAKWVLVGAGLSQPLSFPALLGILGGWEASSLHWPSVLIHAGAAEHPPWPSSSSYPPCMHSLVLSLGVASQSHPPSSQGLQSDRCCQCSVAVTVCSSGSSHNCAESVST